VAAHVSRLLGHPLRHRLLLAYQVEPASASDVARRTGEPVNLVSYHTGVLVRHGWLELVRTEQRRGGTARVYRATAPGFIERDEWQELPVQRRRALVRGLVTSVAGEGRRAALAGGFDAEHAHVSRWPLRLDDIGATEAAQVLRRLIEELSRVQSRSSARAGSRQRLDVVLMGFVATTAQRPAASPARRRA
jgi:hypothetical protein